MAVQSSLFFVALVLRGGERDEREREREKIQALEDIQTANLFLVVEPLLVAVSA